MIVIIAVMLIVIGVVGIIVYRGLVQIPASPPSVAVVKVLGKRQNRVKGEGWRFFFGYPFIMDFVLVNRSNINVDFSTEEVRTPDNAELDIQISLTFHPDYQNSESLNVYLDNNGDIGVKNTLKDIVSQSVLQWARSNAEGPQTWEEAQGEVLEATEVILQKILGVEKLTEEQRQNFTRGVGNYRLPNLGIVLDRLNVDKIAVIGEVAEKAQRAAVETLEQAAEIIELEHIAKRIQVFIDKGFSKEEAANLVFVAIGKASKVIDDHNFTLKSSIGIDKILENLSPEIIAILKNVGLIPNGGKDNG
jgi:hypothetical protein